MPRTSPDLTATGREAPSGAFPIPTLVSILLDKLLEDSAAELQRAEGGTGNVTVSLDIHFANGRPRWHSASAHWVEHRTYAKEPSVG
jgi:hypothetical protein